MKQFFCILLAVVATTTAASAVDDLETVSGKWSTKKVNNEGQNVTQTLEITKAKFIFRILSADGRLILHAEGDLKMEKVGPFSSARFFHIRAGESADDLSDVDDEYVNIYSLDTDTWTMASNLDKQRSGQKPSLDTYKRVKAADTKASK
jgi:hypothetical protein